MEGTPLYVFFSPAGLRHKPQNRDGLHVRRLWKQIKPSQTFQRILSLALPLCLLVRRPRHDLPDIPSLRVYITAHVDDGLRAKCEELPYERLVASLAWRVDDERRPCGRKVADGAKYLRRVARAKRDFVREAVERRVVRRKADRVCGELDSGNLCEVRSKREREETRAAVGVYQVGWRRGDRCGRGGRGREDGVADVRGEGDENRVVILEERAGLVVEK